MERGKERTERRTRAETEGASSDCPFQTCHLLQWNAENVTNLETALAVRDTQSYSHQHHHKSPILHSFPHISKLYEKGQGLLDDSRNSNTYLNPKAAQPKSLLWEHLIWEICYSPIFYIIYSISQKWVHPHIFVNILLYIFMWQHWSNDTLLQCKVVSVQ